MSKVSIVIPSRGERFLTKTVNDLLTKATGDIEIIVSLDGYWPSPYDLPDDPRLTVIHRGSAMGMRRGIMSGVQLSKGEYIMKTDAHCMFAEGFDETLKADCDDNWLVVPRRYSLEPELWERMPKHFIDYHYLDCPFANPAGFQIHGVPWMKMTYERQDKPEYDIDDLMSWQGSMWFMSRKHWDRLGGVSEEGYGSFKQEPQEIGNKTWLGGGRIIINKKTWYAHLHKGSKWGRGYSLGRDEINRGHEYSAAYWMSNTWEDRVHDIEWLIEKFWPVPSWPENWRQILEDWRKNADKSLYTVS